MAFTEVTKGVWGNRTSKVKSVSIAMPINSSAKIIMSSDLVSRLGDPKFIKIMVGSGDDAGKILIAPAGMKTRTTYTLSQPNGGKSKQSFVTISPKKIGLDRTKLPRVTTGVEWTATEDGLMVEFPADWRG